MKKSIFILSLLFLLIIGHAQDLKPYTIGLSTLEQAKTLKPKLITALVENKFDVIGEYQVNYTDDTWVVVFTCDELKSAVQKVGGLTGFASVLRVAITTEDNTVTVSYTTPEYWGNAYFREDFEKVADNYLNLDEKLKTTMSSLGDYNGEQFGSKKGLSVKDIRNYKYMFGMPKFDDTVELESFGSFKEAVAKIDASAKKSIKGVSQVYKIEYPGKELALYGFGLTATDGEQKFMPVIDISSPRHTAFLPYEVLVMGDEVHMLHGRYRIALSFPDLTMGTFTKIMSTPGYIKGTLEKLVE